MLDNTEAARQYLADVAVPGVLSQIDRMVETGIWIWSQDENVSDRVMGLLIAGTNRAVCIVYLDEPDFEVGPELEF